MSEVPVVKHFVTADWHLFHNSILSFCKRPFRGLDHMTEVLVNNFNSTVPEDGVTYFGGDMGMCNYKQMKEVIDRLNGTKILIVGNHDNGMNSMYRAGFDLVLYGVILHLSGEQVTFTHCPLRDTFREDTSKMNGGERFPNWWGENRPKFQKFIVPNNGQIHLHGHIHSPNKGQSKKIEGRQIDIGVDANGYHPVSFSKIESMISQIKRKELNDKKRS